MLPTQLLSSSFKPSNPSKSLSRHPSIQLSDPHSHLSRPFSLAIRPSNYPTHTLIYPTIRPTLSSIPPILLRPLDHPPLSTLSSIPPILLRPLDHTHLSTLIHPHSSSFTLSSIHPSIHRNSLSGTLKTEGWHGSGTPWETLNRSGIDLRPR
jgi:hypothetical protein